MKKKPLNIAVIFLFVLSLSGCTIIFQQGRRSDVRKIEELSSQLDDLTQAKRLLEQQLSGEIKDKQVKLQMLEKGLVITFLADVLFDSGKAKLKPESYPAIDKVARVLKDNVPNLKVGIEGHTDNQPIQYSGWRSNWELSTGRALSVLHYLIDERGVAPGRLSVIGYGEFQAVASNDSSEGRQANRRVEVVILPAVTKVKEAAKAKAVQPSESEYLK